MRFDRDVLAALDNLKRTASDAETRVMKKMRPGESALDCASRQEQIELGAALIIEATTKALGELYALGSSGDCISFADLAEYEITTRQMFEEAAHKSWSQTRDDACQPFHLQAAE